jgi:hypothetical protein
MSAIHIPDHQGVVNGIGLYSVSMHADLPKMYEADVPDPAWTFTDSAGHFHAYDSDGKLPTLSAVLTHVDCDGSCGGICDGDGYSRTERQCPLCDEYVVPATRRGLVRVDTRSDPLMTIEVTGPASLAGFDGDVVSFSCDGRFGSGVLSVTQVTTSFSYDEARATIDMRTPLYRRYGTQMQQTVREPRANLTRAILAGAKAVRAAWGALPQGVPADDFTIDFSALAADRAITAALPLLGLDADGEILP